MNRPPLVEAVRAAVERHRMVTSGQTVVVAVSGGPDSTALLHSLWSLRSELNVRLIAATMEHGIRGGESEGDAEYVLNLCVQLDIPCRLEHRDIPAIAKTRRVSTTIAARDERHSFLRKVARECCAVGAERIALGHTSDDRAETVLMNILRGAGTDGLCAMPAVQLPIIRPILACTRAQISDYCTEIGIQTRTDSSNSIIDYRRNRIRTELLPQLATYYNSGVQDALIRLAEISQDDIEVLADHTASLLSRATIDANSREIVLNGSILRAAQRALQRRAVRQAIGLVRGELTDIGFSMVESVLAAVNGAPATELTLPRTARNQTHVHITGDTLRIWAGSSTARRSTQWQLTLTVPGEIYLPLGGRRLTADVVPARIALAGAAVSGTQITDGVVSICHFLTSDVTDVLIVRSWRTGDRIHPKGLAGTKKLQDLYTDCKVPRSERELVPVVECPGKSGAIVAALGVRCSDLSLNRAELLEAATYNPDEQITVLRLLSSARNVGI